LPSSFEKIAKMSQKKMLYRLSVHMLLPTMFLQDGGKERAVVASSTLARALTHSAQ